VQEENSIEKLTEKIPASIRRSQENTSQTIGKKKEKKMQKYYWEINACYLLVSSFS